MAHERVCIVSPNHHYKYCPHCSQYDSLETWRYLFCSDNCREVYNAVNEYNGKKISAEEAKERLNKCDLSEKDTFTDSIKRILEDIYAETSAKEEVLEYEPKMEIEVVLEPEAQVSEELIIENNDVATSVEVAVEEIETTTSTRKRKGRR